MRRLLNKPLPLETIDALARVAIIYWRCSKRRLEYRSKRWHFTDDWTAQLGCIGLNVASLALALPQLAR